MIERITIASSPSRLTTTGRRTTASVVRIAAWPSLMIGFDLIEPKTKLQTPEGTLDLFAEFKAAAGAISGGVKPVLKNVEVRPTDDDLGNKLFRSLDDDQRKVALVAESFPRFRGGDKKAAAGEPLGLAAAKLNDKQHDMLLDLLNAYMSRYPADVARAELAAAKAAQIDKIYFAFVGDPGQKRAYRLQGPTLLIEFSNEQDDSDKNAHNHVHSVWRNPRGDFGLTGD